MEKVEKIELVLVPAQPNDDLIAVVNGIGAVQAVYEVQQEADEHLKRNPAHHAVPVAAEPEYFERVITFADGSRTSAPLRKFDLNSDRYAEPFSEAEATAEVERLKGVFETKADSGEVGEVFL